MSSEHLALAPPTARRLAAMALRGLRRRCPNCGAGGLFRSHTRLRPACPRCGLLLNRGEEDYFLGAYTINFVTAELGLVAFLGILVTVTWPDVPWNAVLYGGIALMVLMPVLFFPVSRTLWLALDLAFRLPDEGDFLPRASPRPTRR
ncbi:MAG TPA: DUF983 domain-containing protein [Longimicrobiales bacterium]|nr:DUF983 domain-containing protein [Longimicrobiales bacterium]